MLTGPQNMPVFGDNQLSPEEKRDIIAYIQNLKSDADPGGFGIGRLGPVTEGLVIFLVGMVVPDLRDACGLRGSHERDTTITHGSRRRGIRRRRPALTRFDLVREGARRDGVEIVHYEPRFPVPGTKRGEAHRPRASRCCSCWPACSASAFVVVYIAWPWTLRGRQQHRQAATRRCSA